MPYTPGRTRPQRTHHQKSRFIGCITHGRPCQRPGRGGCALEAAPGAAHICWALLAVASLPRWTTANRAARQGGPCWTCCATRTWKACWPPWCVTLGGEAGRGRPGAGLHRPRWHRRCSQPQDHPAAHENLQCQVPYALEGMIRREVEAAGAQLLDVQARLARQPAAAFAGSAGTGFRTTHQRPRAGPRGVVTLAPAHPIWGRPTRAQPRVAHTSLLSPQFGEGHMGAPWTPSSSAAGTAGLAALREVRKRTDRYPS